MRITTGGCDFQEALDLGHCGETSKDHLTLGLLWSKSMGAQVVFLLLPASEGEVLEE